MRNGILSRRARMQMVRLGGDTRFFIQTDLICNPNRPFFANRAARNAARPVSRHLAVPLRDRRAAADAEALQMVKAARDRLQAQRATQLIQQRMQQRQAGLSQRVQAGGGTRNAIPAGYDPRARVVRADDEAQSVTSQPRRPWLTPKRSSGPDSCIASTTSASELSNCGQEALAKEVAQLSDSIFAPKVPSASDPLLHRVVLRQAVCLPGGTPTCLPVLDPRSDMLVFIHIGKAGGTTFDVVLSRIIVNNSERRK